MDQWQRAIILRFGKFHREIGPGIELLWPFYIERPIKVNVVPETMLVGPQSVTTRDDVSVVLSVVVTFSIEEVRKFLLEIEGAHQVIEDSTFGVVSAFILSKTWGELQAIDVANELSKKVRQRAKAYGVNIVSVQICDITRSRSLRLMQSTHHNTHAS